MYILGISCYYHDAAAVLLKDGKIITAVEEERFSRKKHDFSFPKQAIDFCLKKAKIKGKDLSWVVFYEKPFRKFHRILISALATYPQSAKTFREAMRLWLTQKLWIKQEIASHLSITPKKILFSEHHLSHAASCFYPSGFSQAAIFTVDGVGEWTTTAWGTGKGNKISLENEIHFPQSLGLLYSTFTAFLGFRVNSGEWKVMGLAPYGQPRYLDKVRKVVKLHQDGSFSLDFSYFAFHYSDYQSYSEKFVKFFGKPIAKEKSHLVNKRAADIAASIQVVTEELLLNIVKNIHQKTELDNLCFAGGVALNSVANFRLLKEGGFKNIFIQPAAGDSGGALGAALYVYHHVLGNKKRYLLNHVYFGQEYSNSEIEKFLKAKKINSKKYSTQKLIDYTATKIAKGKVIGWMQRRFEWGPRALGARSILADPRKASMKDIVNAKVKFREAFRPFAPSVLGDKAYTVFDLPSDYQKQHPLKYMLLVVPVKASWRKKVPAINHVNNSARPQLVFPKESPLYYQLLQAFYKKTGVPLVLNTSFNLRGEPIVNSPEDAYSTFQGSGIDVLVMGNFVCEK